MAISVNLLQNQERFIVRNRFGTAEKSHNNGVLITIQSTRIYSRRSVINVVVNIENDSAKFRLFLISQKQLLARLKYFSIDVSEFENAVVR